MSLKEQLQEWMDIDFAGLYLARSLGLMNSSVEIPGRAKHVFWSNHPVGNLLKKMLDDMTSAGVLEYREEPDYQYRWNSAFKGSWET